MAVTTNKALLFLAGGVAAAAAVAYGTGALDPLLKRTETIAALPGTDQVTQDAPSPGVASPQPALEVPAQPASPEAPEAAAPAAPDAAAPEAPDSAGDQPVVVAPSFDVVRVEGDGSIVVAGKAAPNAVVDLVVGSNVIGSATAGVDGAFAVVLDDPLKPGDYQIVLRATAPDNVVAMSVETAVVSVPETPEGQVLALVEEPGKPSQMIIRPAPQPPAAVAKPPEAEAPPAAAPPLAETPPEAETPAAEPKPEGEMQAALPEQPGQPEPAPAPAPPPQAGPAVRVEAVEIDGRKIFVAGTAEPGRTVRGYANEILLGDAKASPDGTYLIEAERDLPVGDYIIRVDALEADGVKVAARAAVPFEREPGETLAAVAPPPAAPPAATAPASAAPAPEAPNAPATDTRPAVAEAPAPAPSAPPASAPSATAQAPAEQKPEGAEGSVTARAQPAVPSAEAPAAVADAPDTQAPATEMPAAAPASDPGTPPAAEPPAAMVEAPAAGQPAANAEAPAASAPAQETQASPTADSRAPSSETPAIATLPAGTPTATDAAAPAPPSVAGTETEIAAAPPTPPLATTPPAAAAPATDAKSAPAADAPITIAPSQETQASPSADAEAPSNDAAAAENETDLAPAPAQDGALPAPPPAGVDEVLAPKLQSVGSAVIIRRGDTLWRISRRVYGRGIRYSTIYLANEDQIEDPDRIWPGQVFKVPEKSADGKAEADYSTLGSRLTTVPEDGEQAADPSQSPQ